MLVDIPVPYLRTSALEEFHRGLGRAQWGSLFRRLVARNTLLECFCGLVSYLKTNRRYLGTVDVPVEKTVGTVDRAADFDRVFRPLSARLRDRWVSVYLRAGGGDWPPARLYQTGKRYFVEDGQNRVSAARTLGWPTIRAEVWKQGLGPSWKGEPVRSADFDALPLAESC
jgi:hypothetical protein